MSSKRNVCVVTGTRAEYGLLYWLIRLLSVNEGVELRLVVTGMHLDARFGLTYREIEREFSITDFIPILEPEDTSRGVCRAIANGVQKFGELFSKYAPDVVVILGDRYEMLSVATAAMVHRVPIAHIHGGEATEGLIDEPIRHSITKMSHLHFVATEEYRKRVIQLGEQPDRVFNFGGIGIDNIKQLDLLSRSELSAELQVDFEKTVLLVTFHPVTLEDHTAEEQVKALLRSLSKLDDVRLIFTYANADPGGSLVNQLIDEFVAKNKKIASAFASLGQQRYLSAMSHAAAVIGNSSSGIIEAPSFAVPTVNIGDRQKGRVKADSVIDCSATEFSIDRALGLALSDDFRERLRNVVNPYGTGGTSENIVKHLLDSNLISLVQKSFFDLEVNS